MPRPSTIQYHIVKDKAGNLIAATLGANAEACKAKFLEQRPEFATFGYAIIHGYQCVPINMIEVPEKVDALQADPDTCYAQS